MTAVQGTAQDALNKLVQYPRLSSIIDPAQFANNFNSKYPNGPELPSGKVSDLVIALLIKDIPFFSQSKSNAATPEGVLASIEEVLLNLPFTRQQERQIAVKLLNFGTSSLWDTLTELLLYQTIANNIPQGQIEIEYPLGTGKKGAPAKDADIAILDDTQQPIMLIDAIAPFMNSHTPSVMDTVAKWIEDKYTKKFSSYCQTNPSAKVGIVVSITKAEIVYTGFPMKIANPNYITPILSQKLDQLPGLAFANVCSFRCINGKTLVLDPIATYSRP